MYQTCTQPYTHIRNTQHPTTFRQVYTLLGKLDLTLRRRENTMSAYRREAEEGAREARALLAAAAAQHQREQGRTGTSEDGSSRARHDLGPLIGGREG